MNQNVNINNENKDAKGITFAMIGILTIIVALAGATFAYFQITVTNNNVLKGNSGYIANPLTLTITEVSAVGTASKKLIPQLDAYVRNAANSTNKCIDGNNNAVCQHYSITVKNNTTSKFYLDGIFTLLADDMPNLKWSTCSGVWTCTSDTYNLKTITNLANRTEIASGDTLTYYIVLWISETGSAQSDSGSLAGTINFTAYNSSSTTAGEYVAGVTSTIRS